MNSFSFQHISVVHLCCFGNRAVQCVSFDGPFRVDLPPIKDRRNLDSYGNAAIIFCACQVLGCFTTDNMHFMLYVLSGFTSYI